MHIPIVAHPLIIKNEAIKRDHKTKFPRVILGEKLLGQIIFFTSIVKLPKDWVSFLKQDNYFVLCVHFIIALYTFILTIALMCWVIRAKVTDFNFLGGTHFKLPGDINKLGPVLSELFTEINKQG